MLAALVCGARAAPRASRRLASGGSVMGLTAPSAPLARAGASRAPGPPSPALAASRGVCPGRFAARPALCGPAGATPTSPASLGGLPASALRRALSSSSAASGPRRRRPQRRAQASREPREASASPAPPAAPAPPASPSFFSSTSRAWEDLSLDPAVCRALRSAGFARPSTVQALSAPEQLARRDLVLRAETGSGKTLAYLVPALSDLALWVRLALARSGAAEGESDGDGGGDEAAPSSAAGFELPPSPSTLVVCANVALCAQVEEIGKALGRELLRELEAEAAGTRSETRPSGRVVPLLTPLSPWLFAPASLRSGCAPPPSAPFLAVTTPAGLDSWRESLRGLAASGVAAWARGDPAAWTSRLVVDEADLLLSGSYGKAAEQLLESFRLAEKRRREAYWESALNLRPGGLQRVPHGARRTLLLRGYEAARREGLAIARPQGGDAPGARTGSAGEAARGARAGPAGKCAPSTAAPGAEGPEALVPDLLRTALRRFVPVAFVGATIPTGSRSAAGDVILRSHPTAAWVDGLEAHRAKSDIEMRWASIESGSERALETLRAIADGWRQGVDQEGEEGGPEADGREGMAGGPGADGREGTEGGRGADGREGMARGREAGNGGGNGGEREGGNGGGNGGEREAGDIGTLAELPHVTLVFCRGAVAAREMDAALRETLEASGARVVLHDGGRGVDGAARLAAALRGDGAPSAAGGEGRGGEGERAGDGDEIAGVGVDAGPSPVALEVAPPPCAIPSSRVVVFSTDAAARGLDSSAIRHVVQSDFASSAVDFVHRVGRTGRAGRRGLATSLVAPQDEDLAEAIQDSLVRAQSLEGAFSRKRSFRKRIKKYGKFVPAGQSGVSADGRR